MKHLTSRNLPLFSIVAALLVVGLMVGCSKDSPSAPATGGTGGTTTQPPSGSLVEHHRHRRPQFTVTAGSGK